MSSTALVQSLRLDLPYMRGKDVLAVQKCLSAKGITEADPPDGIFTHRTRSAVRKFQRNAGLDEDGIVGPKTWDSLFRTMPFAPTRSEAVTIVARGAKPPERPQLEAEELDAKIAHLAVDRKNHPLIVVGIRGYFGKFGDAPGNERGIYDDALFVHSTGSDPVGFNGNTDPSRRGYNPKVNAGFAVLNTGLWCVYQFAKHNGSKESYDALCQRAGEVTVTRDPRNGQDGGTQHTGRSFGINIHKGSRTGTSSEGCQTIHPDQWEEFYKLCRDEAIHHFGEKEWRNEVIPYALIDAEENEKRIV
jgi:Putative peptidoglycan binding domain